MRWRLAVAMALVLLACDDRPKPAPSAATASASASASATASTSASATASASASASPSASALASVGGIDPWLDQKLRAVDPRMAGWLDQAEALRIQVLVSVVEDASVETPQLERHGLRVDAEYVYPASAIKIFLAAAVLRELKTWSDKLGVPLGPGTSFRRCQHASGHCEIYPEDEDEDDEDGTFTVRAEIRKLLSYSDNHSYERLYDIVGHQDVNELVASMGLPSVRIHHRMGAPAERSRSMPRLLVIGKGAVLPARKSTLQLAPTPAKSLKIGSAYRDGREQVDEPMDFANKNYASLRDLQRMLVSLLYPKAKGAAQLGLDDEQRKIMIGPMTGKLEPVKSVSHHKPMLPGLLEVVDGKRLRYVGKSGRAYGFHLENAFIEDTETKRAVFVTAVIYANPNGVLNDDDYDYDDTATPFMEAVGKALALAVFAGKG